MRARNWVMLAVAALVGLGYSRLSRSWTDAEFYAGLAAAIAGLVVLGMPWIELARDGAFRRPRDP
jgi:hypothetical protein